MIVAAPDLLRAGLLHGALSPGPNHAIPIAVTPREWVLLARWRTCSVQRLMLCVQAFTEVRVKRPLNSQTMNERFQPRTPNAHATELSRWSGAAIAFFKTTMSWSHDTQEEQVGLQPSVVGLGYLGELTGEVRLLQAGRLFGKRVRTWCAGLRRRKW